MTPKLSVSQFVERAKAAWGDRFDYSKVQYSGATKKVMIICPDHGVFSQLPINHWNGSLGCKACRSNKISKSVKNNETFIEQVKQVWGERWDLSQTKYVNNKFKVTVLCREHGEFEQLPRGLLAGSVGCKSCKSKLHAVTHRTLDTNSFIQLSISVWGDRFDYSQTEYRGSKTHVNIRCPKHGTFQQLPYAHLKQHCGCKVCVKLKQQGLSIN
ncbi:hypothetical protein [Photobacterium leiognathi]|uniref:hypothetical protein n=1 Tax=Photobacterium leiognathi TaxID=553611 RepID=UPI002980CADF|nr:hypothetical protein [Photobacterium leiognathi]